MVVQIYKIVSLGIRFTKRKFIWLTSNGIIPGWNFLRILKKAEKSYLAGLNQTLLFLKAIFNILFLTSALLVLFTGCDNGPDPDDPIEVPAKSFRDALFGGLLDENGDPLIIDTDGNGNISYAEAEVVTYLNVGDKGITDLTGIEAFINLEYLLCFQNELNDLDISENKALVGLSCWGNSLATLDLSPNTDLDSLDCGYNQLSALDISLNESLFWLQCSQNKLATLDVSQNSLLTNLYCSDNQLSALDVSSNPSLISLMCDSNQLSALDLTNNANLEDLYCGFNHISSLELSNNPALSTLDCTDNQLTTLVLSNNRELLNLYCSHNQLSSLSISASSKLIDLFCSNNQLSSIHLTNKQSLRHLYCGYNQISSLNISNNFNLWILDVTEMPTLGEVCVWVTPFPPEYILVNSSGSPSVYFTTSCSK